LTITGYVLEIDDGYNGLFTKIYDGTENAQTLEFVLQNLKP
jgi:hypothetical protein